MKTLSNISFWLILVVVAGIAVIPILVIVPLLAISLDLN